MAKRRRNGQGGKGVENVSPSSSSSAPVQPAAPPRMAPVDLLGVRSRKQLDKELVSAALRKLQQDKKPNRREQGALNRWNKARDEASRWEHYRSIPQKHWIAMSGRQAKVINEQAATYGLPFGGSEIELPRVVRALHDFLARNARKLASITGEDPILFGEDTPALEKLRNEKYLLAKLERRRLEGSLLPRDEMHEGLARLADILRQTGDKLQRQCGAEAHQIWDDGLVDFKRIVGELFGDAKEDRKT